MPRSAYPLILHPVKNGRWQKRASPRHCHDGIDSLFDVCENHTGKEIAKAVALADDMISC
jgi:hypothetical protein